MRKLHLIHIVLGLGLGLGCQKQPASETLQKLPEKNLPVTLARGHFIGAGQLSADTNAVNLKKIGALPETRELRAKLLSTLAGALDSFFVPRDNTGRLVRYQPLLEDLVQAESFFEIRKSNNSIEWGLAIHLEEKRRQVWRTNLFELVTAGTTDKAVEVQIEGFPAWELRRIKTPNLFRLVQAGPWLVLGVGQDRLEGLTDFVGQIKKSGRPITPTGDAWIDAEANAAWLAAALALPDWMKGPPGLWPQTAYLTVNGRGENVRTKCRLVYPSRLALSFERWLIPTNTIRDDALTSFTAVQNVAAWLNKLDWVKQLQLQPTGNQLYVWALGDIPFLTYAALPAKQASNLIERTAIRLPAVLASKIPGGKTADILLASNRTEFIWRGLPIVVPFLRLEKETMGDFLLAGIFPTTPSTNPPPPQLVSQLTGRTNLFYYDWEITQNRLAQWRTLAQIAQLIALDLSNATDTTPTTPITIPAQAWLTAVGNHLGEAVTEITLTSPQELTLVRKSSVGLTGVELVALVRWFQSPEFPSLKGRATVRAAQGPGKPPATP